MRLLFPILLIAALVMAGCADLARWNARMHGYPGDAMPGAPPCTPTGQRIGLCTAQGAK